MRGREGQGEGEGARGLLVFVSKQVSFLGFSNHFFFTEILDHFLYNVRL